MVKRALCPFLAGSAHVGAMYAAFLTAATASGAPGLVAALALGELCCWPLMLAYMPANLRSVLCV